jgi:hypothetical protein
MILDAARVAPEKAVFRPALPMILLPGLNGTGMTKLTYSEQLRHPNWQRVRLEVLNRAGWKCEVCSGGDTTLHVHHKRYIKGRMAWEYDLTNFASLCEECHSQTHAHRDKLDAFFAELPIGLHDAAIAVLSGWAAPHISFETRGACATSPIQANIGFLARQIEDSPLNIYEVCDLADWVSSPEMLGAIRGTLASLRATMDAQIEADLAARRDPGKP